jgi:7-cyano-7-deazaguanine synthase
MKHKAIVVLSGGQDSTTCLAYVIDRGFEPITITFDYNQRHAREIQAARDIALLYNVKHEVIQLGPILKGTSPLVDSSEELEQYKDHQSLPGGLEKTFVPMRNQLFLTIAANRAYVEGAGAVVTGVCEEDYGGYPDCRQKFIDLFAKTTVEGTFTNGLFRVITPLMHLTKRETVQLALELPGCYEALAFSHTSYDGQYPPTGKDHATLLRAKGFEEAGIPDPLILRAYIDGSIADLPETSNYNGATPYLNRVQDAMEILREKKEASSARS